MAIGHTMKRVFIHAGLWEIIRMTSFVVYAVILQLVEWMENKKLTWSAEKFNLANGGEHVM